MAVLPVDLLALLFGEVDFLALFVGQFRPSHIRIREIARLEAGAAKVSVLQVRPDKIDFAEIRRTKIASRKVGVGEVDLVEVIPAQGGLGQVRVLERNVLNVRPAEEGAWESQIFQITLADIFIPLLDVLADEGAEERNPERFFIALRAVVR